MSRSDDEREYEERIRRDVAEHGCHTAIVPGSGDSTLCAFTIGLWQKGHPEVVVFGLERNAAEELLDLLQDEVESGARFAAGEKYEDLVQGYPVVFREVAPERVAMFEPAVQFHGTVFPMLQVFWPDRLGRFPWDEGAQEHCRRSQPRLERP